MRRAVAVLVMLAACGRVGFDAVSAVDGAPRGDGSTQIDGPVVHDGPPRVLIMGAPGSGATTMFENWLAGRAATVETLQGRLDTTILARTDLLVVRALQTAADDLEREALASFVQQGGALVQLSGFTDMQQGADLATSLSSVFGVVFRSDINTGPVTALALHPVNDGVSSVVFMGGDTAVSTGGSTFVPTAWIGGNAVAGVVEVGVGRVYLWADEWVTSDSTWVQASSEQFWTAAFDWLWPVS
ncbi:MAG: hypothetical protein JNL83_32690 [Myxococcales bacterium]|nr:hypothetical protein [Myxococcales bacterium]